MDLKSFTALLVHSQKPMPHRCLRNVLSVLLNTYSDDADPG